MGALHNRRVICLKEHDCWIVVDDVSGEFSGVSRLHWLFPNYEFAWEEDERRLWMQTPAGPFQCCVYTLRPAKPTLVRGGCVVSGEREPASELLIRGWRSLYYGTKEAALSLAIEADCPTRFVSVLAPADTVISAVSESELTVRAGGTEEKIKIQINPDHLINSVPAVLI